MSLGFYLLIFLNIPSLLTIYLVQSETCIILIIEPFFIPIFVIMKYMFFYHKKKALCFLHSHTKVMKLRSVLQEPKFTRLAQFFSSFLLMKWSYYPFELLSLHQTLLIH